MTTDTTPSAADERAGVTAVSMSPGKQAFRRFLQHRAAVGSVVLLTIIVIFVVLAPITARYGVSEAVIKIGNGRNQFLRPSSRAWFGTDDIGHDVYSLIIYGCRVSLLIGLASAVVSVVEMACVWPAMTSTTAVLAPL